MAKVCILTSVHPPFDIRVFHKQAKTLANEGHLVTLVAQHDRDETIEGITICAIPKFRSRIKRMLLAPLLVFLKGIQSGASVYHFHDPELLFVGIILRLMGKKVIYDVHEDYAAACHDRQYLAGPVRRPLGAIFSFLERHASQHFSYVISATDGIHRKFEDLPHAGIVRNYPFKPPVRKTERTPRTGPITLVFAGVLVDIYGISQVIRALEYLPENIGARLILCGRFSPESYETDLRGLRAFAKVDFRGWIPYEEVFGIIENADVGMLCYHPVPNNINSLPNKMFEYMSAGVPIIASHFPLWREIIERSGCGICVDPLDPREIARAVHYFFENPDEAIRMGQTGQEAVHAVFNWDIEKRSLLEIYDKVLGSQSICTTEC